MPGTLSLSNAKVAAVCCKEILAGYEIMDVEIAFRESVFTRSTRPLLDHVHSVHSIADVHSPFTPALGLQIAHKTFPYLEGTGCLYMRESKDSDRVLLLTARHVVLPPCKYPNTFYHRKNNKIPRIDVIHLSSKAYQTAVEAIMVKVRHETYMIDYYKDGIETLGAAAEDENAKTTAKRQAYERKLVKAEKSKASADDFYNGPGPTGDKQFTEDWALVELDREKFDWTAFRSNVIHLGTKLTAVEFIEKMYPCPDSLAKFKYPHDGLMSLRMNGSGTGVTFGRATTIESFVRNYKDYRIDSTSMEIAIYPYSHKDDAFSGLGDSGSVIGDANNRIVGMITGLSDSIDVTYATPYYFLDECIKKAFPNSFLYPIPA